MGSSSENKTSGSLELHDYMLKEMRGQFKDLGKKVDEGHDISKTALRKIDEHIVTCEKRYKEMLDNSPPGGTTALISRKSIQKKVAGKLIEKIIDYGILVVIMMTIFAFKSGFKLPNPLGADETPTPAAHPDPAPVDRVR